MNPKRVTSQDVANRAGVSRTTVSLVLNNVKDAQISNETRKKVLRAASELDYHPDASARRLVQGRSQVIGFVERHSPYQNFADAFMAEVLRGLHGVARQHHYHVLFEPTSEKRESDNDFVKLIRERHADGIVLSGPRFDDQQLFQHLGVEIPIVLQGRLPGCHIPSVDVDNVGGARLATEHLLTLGNRRIGMITNGPLEYTAASDRRAGYMQALQAGGIEFESSMIQIGAFSPESGYHAMQRLLELNPPLDAIFVASDVVAIGAIEAARQASLRIPDDLAVVGFDDIPWSAYLNPPLTTVRLPAYSLGWKAGYLLIQLFNQEEIEEKTILLETQLIVRKSCGAQTH